MSSKNDTNVELWHTVPWALRAVWITVYLIWIVVPLAGNSILLFVSLKTPAIRQERTTYFLISIYMASLMVTIIATPGEMLLGTGLGETFLPSSVATVLCKLCVYSFILSSFANVWSQVASVIDQWLSIVHGKTLTRKQTKAVVACTWLLAAAYASRNLITTGYYTIPGSTSVKGCTENANFFKVWQYLVISDIIFGYVIPLIIFLFCYFSIKHHVKQECSRGHWMQCSHCNKRSQLARTLLAMGVCFGILLFPRIVVCIFMAFGILVSLPFVVEMVVYQTMILITLSHDSVSFFVGLKMDKELRKTVKDCLMEWLCSGKKSAVVEPANERVKNTKIHKATQT